MTVQSSGAADIADWLLRDAPGHNAEPLLTGLVDRLVAAGVPVWRCRLALKGLHPELFSTGVQWTQGVGTKREFTTHERRASVVSAGQTPVFAIFDGADEIRCRLEPGSLPFPVLEELRDRGGSDYIILGMRLSEGVRGYVSYATNFPGGFTDEDLALLRSILPVLALRMELVNAHFTTQGLLDVYLGPNAARRVLSGAVRRGSGEIVRSVIWFSDMRGFTALSDVTPVREVVALLDRYFESVAGPVTDNGGEVLKFIGDAMLAVFPVGDDPREPCRRALSAAEAGLAAVGGIAAERAAAGLPPIAIGISLHLGDVMYGNIGARERLDFTVIGAAVNEASRVESLCKELARRLLMTKAFADAHGGAGLVSLGQHALKGVAGAREIFGLVDG